jgi:hypothetical protein
VPPGGPRLAFSSCIRRGRPPGERDDKNKNADPSGAQFAAKAKVLKDLVEHHAEEEETGMFPRARKQMDRARLRPLACVGTSRSLYSPPQHTR